MKLEQEVIADVQLDGLHFLGQLYRDREAIHPAAALSLLAELSDRLSKCALSPVPDRETHRALLAIAQTCVDAAEQLEHYLETGEPFEWSAKRALAAPQRMEHLMKRLERIANSLDVESSLPKFGGSM